MWLLVFVLLQTAELGAHFQSVEALSRSLVQSTVGQNCSRYIFSSDGFEHGGKSTTESFTESEQTVGLMCPPWFRRTGGGECKIEEHISCLHWEERTFQLWLQNSYCMTTSNAIYTNRTDIIGRCFFSALSLTDLTPFYYPLPCNISQLNSYTCAGLNREGQLCGRCVDGYAPPVLSYSLSCVNCTDYHLNWLKYIGAGFGPLTIFCLLVCVFHINAMSPYLFGFVFYCQLMTTPTVMRLIQLLKVYGLVIPWSNVGFNVYINFLSIWNLDFLHSFYEPFCLHSEMTIIQAITLDYIIAIYPLVLLLTAFILVSLYSKNAKIIVAVWKPFKMVMRPCFRNLNIQTSLIESFATLYFLSAMKVQSVTLDLLSTTTVYHTAADGRVTDKLYLLLAGDVQYFGKDHLPYALLALFFFTVFFLLPVLLLLFYPCQCFQRLLNKIHCNFIALRIFLDTFQGYYKDGTNNTRDYRFFAGIFFLARFTLVAAFVLKSLFFALVVIGIIITLLTLSVLILHPQRTKTYYIFDCLMLVFMSLSYIIAIVYVLDLSLFIPFVVTQLFACVGISYPIVYVSCIVCYWIIGKRRFPQRLVQFVKNRMYSTSLDERFIE